MCDKNMENPLGKSHICVQNPEDLQKPNGQGKERKLEVPAQGDPGSESIP